MNTKLWTKNYSFMLISNLFIYLGFYTLVPTLPAYTKLCGGTSLEASLVVSLFSITSLVFRLFSGSLMDNIDIKPLITAGVVILAATTFTYIWLPITGIIILRIIQGIGWGLASTAAAATFSKIVPSSRRGEGLGYYSLSMIIAMSLSPMTAIVIMNIYDFKHIAILSITFVIIGLIFAKAVKIPENSSPNKNVKQKFSFKNAFEKKALLPSLLCFLLSITLCGIMSYLMIYGKEIKLKSIWIYFIGHVLMILITRPFIGKIFDKKGHAVIILPGSISMLVGLIILSFANSNFTLILASLFYGLGYGAVQPSLQTWAVNRSPENRKGAANGTFLSSMDLAFTFGSIFLSFIADHRSYAVMYRVSAIFILLLMGIYFYKLKQVKSSGKTLEEQAS